MIGIQCGSVITRSFFFQNAHKGHRIVRPLGRDMWCVCGLKLLNLILPKSLQWCMLSCYTGLCYNGTRHVYCTNKHRSIIEKEMFRSMICFLWRCHDMKTLSTFLALCAGNPRLTGWFSAQKGSNVGFCFFSLLLAWTSLRKAVTWFVLSWHPCDVTIPVYFFDLRSCRNHLDSGRDELNKKMMIIADSSFCSRDVVSLLFCA